jgi:hypothetical protein
VIGHQRERDPEKADTGFSDEHALGLNPGIMLKNAGVAQW